MAETLRAHTTRPISDCYMRRIGFFPAPDRTFATLS